MGIKIETIDHFERIFSNVEAGNAKYCCLLAGLINSEKLILDHIIPIMATDITKESILIVLCKLEFENNWTKTPILKPPNTPPIAYKKGLLAWLISRFNKIIKRLDEKIMD